MIQPLDRIFLQEITFQTIIGAFKWEKTIQQTILVDVSLYIDIQKAAKYDDLTLTIDYDKVCTAVITCGQSQAYQLIETLAENIAQQLLKMYPLLAQIEVTVYKPGAVAQAKTVGVSITRTQTICC